MHDGFFAHLHICTFTHLHICRNLRTCAKCFWTCASLRILFCICARTCKNVFSRICTVFQILTVFAKKSKKVEISENVRKCPEKSSRVPEWYTSGSWANAFDNTGWQKSPEYALIRIAAGAPDLAKSGQIRPRTAPDGKSSRIRRQVSLLLHGLKSCPELFFPDHAHRLVRVRRT